MYNIITWSIYLKIGKTCLIKCYITSNDLDPNKAITIIENYQCFVKIDNEPMTICICDTAGQEGGCILVINTYFSLAVQCTISIL
jgi:hypothetical protein